MEIRVSMGSDPEVSPQDINKKQWIARQNQDKNKIKLV
jgi:hypothetical protein